MSTCEKMQELFVEALYGDLNAEQLAMLDSHLAACSDCKAELAGMRSTLRVMDGRVRPEPGDDFWRSFDTKLEERINESPTAQPKVISFRKRIPQWAWQAAAALFLVGVGVVIGRFYIKQEPGIEIARNPAASIPVQTVSTEAETRRFLEKSEVLLIGVVNTDSTNEEAYSADLAHQKKVSRDLIQEASLIKPKLNDPRQRRLRELVGDLEVILLQIANLEAEHDQPEIEILKSGVDRKGLLLKINLEQLRLSNPKIEKPASAKKADPSV